MFNISAASDLTTLKLDFTAYSDIFPKESNDLCFLKCNKNSKPLLISDIVFQVTISNTAWF